MMQQGRMWGRRWAPRLAAAWLAGASAIAAAAFPTPSELDPAPTAQDWVAISRLPDWSGYWIPNIRDQTAQETGNTPPWNAKVAKEMARARADQDAGKPWGLFANCLPEGLPSGILVNHVGMEWVFAPGRLYMFGDGDGNKLRRIFTDGRGHTADPNPTLYGESVGHWEGDTLVVDTTGLLPQTILAINEAIGVPNDGDMHVVERIHLTGPNEMHDDLTITAPKILTRPWKTTRIYTRDRRRIQEIKEAVCVQGTLLKEGTDRDGHAGWAPAQYDQSNGTPVPVDGANVGGSK
jgi:hypothetical protein